MNIERPVIFSAPMVRALLAGRKTQTRRIVKGVDECPHGYDGVKGFDGGGAVRCPYGTPGDRLWVRETFAFNVRKAQGYVYRADIDPATDGWKWTPAIHMPRAASRLWLEVTGIRAERLQELSRQDAEAEGVGHVMPKSAVEMYRDLWDSLNAKRAPWASNPWVWVVSFRRAS